MRRKLFWLAVLTVIAFLSGCPSLSHKPPVLNIPDQTVVQGSLLELHLPCYVIAKDAEGVTFAVIDSVGEIVENSTYRYNPEFTTPREEHVQITATNPHGRVGSGFFKISITPKYYEVSLSASPTDAGSAQGAGSFAHGTIVEVKASPDEEWNFIDWTEESTRVSNESEYMFSITYNRHLTANFALKTYRLDTSTHGQGVVTRIPDKQEYEHGEAVELNAVASEGWEFSKWVINGNQTDVPSTKITMTEDTSAVAYFSRMQFSLTLNAEGMGHVEKEVIFSPSDYSYETQIKLTAIPNAGWGFKYWGGDLSGSNNPEMIVIDEDKEVTANFFEAATVSLEANPPEGGSVSGEGTYFLGDHVEVNAKANTGWIFINWTEGDYTVSTSLSYSFEVEEDRQLVANFVKPTFIWGVPHSHTSYSDGVGSPAQAYEYAMSQNIDFLFITDHSCYLVGDRYDSEHNQFLETEGSLWHKTRIQAEDFNSEYADAFTALRGFEMTLGSGHLDVYNTTNYVERNTMPKLSDFYQWLLYVYEEEGGQVIASFCHPFRPSDSFNNLAYVPELDKVIQMIEVGNGEPHRYTRAESYYIKALDNGWHVGAINAQDNHNYNWGKPDNLTGLVVFQEGPEGIYEAMQSRRVYATETRKLEMTFLANGQWMGSVVPEKVLDFTIVVYDPDAPIKKLQVITNGGLVLETLEVSGKNHVQWGFSHVPSPGRQWFYIRVTHMNGAMAWSSPIFTPVK